MDLSVKMSEKDLDGFKKAIRDQIPYGVALALTRTAAQAKDRVKEDLPKHFKIRNKYTGNSIRSQRAEKRDWPQSKALVGSIAPYLEIQEDGGSKSPTGKAFSIPKGIRTNDLRVVPRSKWPGKLLPPNATIPMGGRTKGAKIGSRSKKLPFLLPERDGIGVYVRTGKGRQVKRLFRLTRATLHVKGRHWLVTPVTGVVKANLAKNFDEALSEALRTSR